MPSALHDEDYTALVQLLKEMRKDAGITQVELAKRLGVEQSFVSKVERQERRIDVAELRRVCVSLGITLTLFVSRFETTLAVKATENANGLRPR